MTTFEIVKAVVAYISFSIMATWYVMCWLCKKNEKLEKPVLILAFVLAGIAILACTITAMGA